ncbi:hypothetical protein JW935_21385 [candidate division KSB1 bacterium]|nr:hypothetical protein [candidate division KSB1 bacterium]
MKMHKILLCFMLPLLVVCQTTPSITIYHPMTPTPLEKLAVREVRRYIYLRTGQVLPIQPMEKIKKKNTSGIVIAQQNSNLLQSYQMNLGLEEQEYKIKTVNRAKTKDIIITGGNPTGVLYGAYKFAEFLGARFYLHGDVVPDENIPLELWNLDDNGQPLFKLRGILPFHDFPEGPDWWDIDDYKAIIAQLPKLGMNFFGLHTYPEGSIGPEPLTWIGFEADLNVDGTVKSAYPARHFTTQTDQWGYTPKATSDYEFGASLLFERDDYGAEYMQGVNPWGESTPEVQAKLFNDMGEMLDDVFTLARELDIRTCIGTETPLTIPSAILNVLEEIGVDPKDPQVVPELYKGIFERIKRTHPLDYYWFWTPEYWTWDEDSVDAATIQATEDDIFTAYRAAQEVQVSFTLATCGWVLGPPGGRARFDQVLPKDMPFSCINREVGFSPVDTDFENMHLRPKWAIPWLEDDPAMISPQLWVGRVRRDAVDALKYGCNGLFGIHWRTRNIGPSVAALAHAAWGFEPWIHTQRNDRDYSPDDFYLDWAKSQFGPNVAEKAAEIFVRLDGGPYMTNQNEKKANLPRTSKWNSGPGAILPQDKSIAEINQEFDFIKDFEELGGQIITPGYRARYEYWLQTFKFARATARVGSIIQALDKVVVNIETEKNPESRAKIAREKALPLRRDLDVRWQDMEQILLATVSTPGELGTIANLEQHSDANLNLRRKHDDLLMEIVGEPLATSASKEYKGDLRIIVPTKGTLLEKESDFNLKVICLSENPILSASLFWKILGTKNFTQVPLTHVARGVYTVEISAQEINRMDFEYYVFVENDSETTVFPPTAPDINHTVVIFE